MKDEDRMVVGHDIGICIATLLPHPMEPTEADVREALEAAAAAGFTHVSIWADHLAQAGGRRGYDASQEVLAGLGLRVSMVEGTTSWVTGSPPAWGPTNDELIEAAASTEAAYLLAACLEPPPIDEDVARRGLHDVAQAAEKMGITVCLEFLPWTGVADLAAAWSLIEPLGPNVAVLIDTFHWQRQPGGPAPAVLAAVPGGRIGAVQLCDAAAHPGDDLMTEAMTARLIPGHGVVDISAVLDQVDATGATPVVTAEIFNSELLATERPASAARSMRAALSGL